MINDVYTHFPRIIACLGDTFRKSPPGLLNEGGYPICSSLTIKLTLVRVHKKTRTPHKVRAIQTFGNQKAIPSHVASDDQALHWQTSHLDF
jgi:hypothetical protein